MGIYKQALCDFVLMTALSGFKGRFKGADAKMIGISFFISHSAPCRGWCGLVVDRNMIFTYGTNTSGTAEKDDLKCIPNHTTGVHFQRPCPSLAGGGGPRHSTSAE